MKPSKREIQVILLIAKGLNETEIGKVLRISKRTVATHKIRLFKKLEAKNQMQIVIFALKKGYVKLREL